MIIPTPYLPPCSSYYRNRDALTIKDNLCQGYGLVSAAHGHMMDAVSSLRRGWLMLCESIDRGAGVWWGRKAAENKKDSVSRF